MDKLQSYTRKAPTPCNGFKVDIQPNPMTPIKSIRWRRASVTESGADLNGLDAEDVPYLLLYFTVSCPDCNFCSHFWCTLQLELQDRTSQMLCCMWTLLQNIMVATR